MDPNGDVYLEWDEWREFIKRVFGRAEAEWSAEEAGELDVNMNEGERRRGLAEGSRC